MTDDPNDLVEPLTPGMDLRERRLLADLEASGRLGTPIAASSMPFTFAPEDISRAIVSGAPRFATRRRRIEAIIDTLVRDAENAWRSLAEQNRRRPDHFTALWHRWVSDVDVAVLNRLIAANNAYYPIEARLPVDIRTGAYLTFDGRDYRYPVVSPAWLLNQFPADLDAALEARDESAQSA